MTDIKNPWQPLVTQSDGKAQLKFIGFILEPNAVLLSFLVPSIHKGQQPRSMSVTLPADSELLRLLGISMIHKSTEDLRTNLEGLLKKVYAARLLKFYRLSSSNALELQYIIDFETIAPYVG